MGFKKGCRMFLMLIPIQDMKPIGNNIFMMMSKRGQIRGRVNVSLGTVIDIYNPSTLYVTTKD